ncbi:unnamed protein product [Adineta ricciae]|uniref:Uncharacterized protein n=1 Tax=Adineta ricciae TaxID=249248 RepID=A0A814AWQ0_ADIRI|nr:unnamed protein product [Adineta ricciae]
MAATVSVMGVVVAAVVYIGTSTPTAKPVFESEMQLAIDRPIAVYELDFFFSPRATLADFIESLNAIFNSDFPGSCIKVIVTAFSVKPIMVPGSSNGMDQTKKDTPALVVLNASAYFTEAKTAQQIRTALTNYTRLIVLINKYSGQPSGRLSTIDMQRSTFTDAVPEEITRYRAKALKDITVDDIPSVPDPVPEPDGVSTTSPPPSARTCDRFMPAYMSVTFERSFAAMEQLAFVDPVSTLRDLAATVQNKIFSTFSITFVKLEILLFSDSPIFISQTNTVLTTVICRIFLTSHQHSTLIASSFGASTQYITLLNTFDDSSSALASFSPKYSIFTNSYDQALTSKETTELTGLCIKNLYTVTMSTPTTTTRKPTTPYTTQPTKPSTSPTTILTPRLPPHRAQLLPRQLQPVQAQVVLAPALVPVPPPPQQQRQLPLVPLPLPQRPKLLAPPVSPPLQQQLPLLAPPVPVPPPLQQRPKLRAPPVPVPPPLQQQLPPLAPPVPAPPPLQQRPKLRAPPVPVPLRLQQQLPPLAPPVPVLPPLQQRPKLLVPPVPVPLRLQQQVPLLAPPVPVPPQLPQLLAPLVPLVPPPLQPQPLKLLARPVPVPPLLPQQLKLLAPPVPAPPVPAPPVPAPPVPAPPVPAPPVPAAPPLPQQQKLLAPLVPVPPLLPQQLQLLAPPVPVRPPRQQQLKLRAPPVPVPPLLPQLLAPLAPVPPPLPQQPKLLAPPVPVRPPRQQQLKLRAPPVPVPPPLPQLLAPPVPVPPLLPQLLAPPVPVRPPRQQRLKLRAPLVPVPPLLPQQLRLLAPLLPQPPKLQAPPLPQQLQLLAPRVPPRPQQQLKLQAPPAPVQLAPVPVVPPAPVVPPVPVVPALPVPPVPPQRLSTSTTSVSTSTSSTSTTSTTSTTTSATTRTTTTTSASTSSTSPSTASTKGSTTMVTTALQATTGLSTIGTPAVTTTSRCRLNDGAHEAYMSLGLLLSIANDDNTEYFDMSSAFENFRSTINTRLQAMFPATFLKFNILMMSNGPIEFTAAGRKRRKRQLNRATVVIVIGNAYFTESVARANIRTSFQGYTLNIDLKRSDDSRSSRVSYFSADHSIFGDTMLTDLNSDEIAYLTPVC